MSDSSWSPKDEEALLAASHEGVLAESQSEISTLGERLANLPVGPKERNRERIGDAVLRTLRAERERRSAQVLTEPSGDLLPSRLANCQALDRPVFSIQSPEDESPTTFSRADAQAGPLGATLEVLARAGAINGVRYPSSDQFILPYNTATASIGAAVAIPPHGSAVHRVFVLDVKVELRLEHPWDTAPVSLGKGEDLIWTNAGHGDLLLRGTSVAWCRAGLTLLGANGTRSRKSIEIVSGWAVNRDRIEMDQEDGAPDGIVKLSHAAAISSELVVAGIFVDVTCFAAAEESQANEWESAYAELNCRTGDRYPPSRLRLDPEGIRVRLCEMPALVIG